MNALSHPSDLNYFEVYRQARRVLRHTSRARNADWYRSAHELGRQWHLWIDGEEIVSAIFSAEKGEWHEGPLPVLPARPNPGLPAEYSKDRLRGLHETLFQILRGKGMGGKTNSLGVVIHVADEFGMSELAPEYAADEEFEIIRSQLASDPWETLGDQGVDLKTHSWRLLPYWGVVDGDRRSVAVQLSLQHAEFVARLKEYGEQRNIPVIVAGVSAPLEAMRLAPIFLDSHAKGDGQVLAFVYRAFTVLSLFNGKGGLSMVRCLPHRKGQNFPARLGEALVNSSAAVNLHQPQVTIVPMREFDVAPLSKELASFFSGRTPMDIGLVDRKEISCLQGVPENRVELGFRDPAVLAELDGKEGFAGSETFEELDAGWATQDFYGNEELEAAIYPARSDLKLLRFFGLSKWFLAIATIGFGALTGLDFVRTMNKDYWRLDEPDARTAEIRLSDLETEKKRIEHWENMMAKRSEGWLAMEVLLGLFSPDSGLVVADCSYAAKGDPPDKKSNQLPFTRSWIVKGYARDEGLAELSRLGSRSFMEKRFAEIAEDFEVESLLSNSDTRQLSVTMQQRKGQMPSGGRYPTSVARFYRNAFELKVIQSFGDRDSLALNSRPPEES